MRAALSVVLGCALAILAQGCDGGGGNAPTGSLTPSVSTSVAAATAAATASTVEGELEVTGIVGAVNLSSRTIQIDRIRGADVTQIAIAPGTVMRSAEGASIGLGQIRASDRIIARGQLSERGDSLVASEITVQEVVPRSAPGR